MSLRPDAGALLAVARRTLLDTILPALPEEQRYDVLMIANAMAIAGRELAPVAEWALAEQRMYAAFVGAGAGVADQPGAPAIDNHGAGGTAQGKDVGLVDAADAEPERLLARRIRARAIPAEDDVRLRALLRAVTLARLKISNPKYPTR
ncbi:acyl-CoA dehydrogenase [Pusillimonas sp. TS35]|uniref:DUF6285 domain-containing protein n=1 Tax=Paracandidimonas lactea TaxID=2895524 RepID=UPI0013714E3F|nr:DUF6285 domain-containing protein [Paracandidimonas lactea]MYN13599.1 acyl-CoA dehydrogenase [Pusillimonas sp. TS35]